MEQLTLLSSLKLGDVVMYTYTDEICVVIDVYGPPSWKIKVQSIADDEQFYTSRESVTLIHRIE